MFGTRLFSALLVSALGGAIAPLAGCTSQPQTGESPTLRGAPGASDRDAAADPLINAEELSPQEEQELCGEAGAECGFIADGRGGVVECGGCDADEACGVQELNRCTGFDADEWCEPLSEGNACEEIECGVVGDGCGGTYECGQCDPGETCGLIQPFQCAESVGADNCPAEIVSCESVGAECGQIGNGCGALLDCDAELGGCDSDEICGGDEPNRCAQPSCEPLSEAEACEDRCGVVSNGCGVEVNGGTITCGACPDGQTCGGAGTPNECGEVSEACVPEAPPAACGSIECGATTDGCDGSVECGACAGGLICVEGSCQPPCTLVSMAVACADKECGQVSDGCDGSYDCGGCDSGEACGIAEAFQCDVEPPAVCSPLAPAVACAAKECGVAYDGCGSEPANRIDCEAFHGGCPAGEFCGILQPFECDAPTPPGCSPSTSCAELDWECGIAFDECGNMFDCSLEGRSCNPDTETCIGGVSAPTICDNGLEDPGGSGCSVCSAIPDCSQQPQRTTLTGQVITPGRNGSDSANQVGVPNAFVYILTNNDPSELPAVPEGIPAGGTACDRCEEQDLGPVLASATTDALGNFELVGDVPVGTEFVLVVKIGRFRRAVRLTLDASAACATTVVDSDHSRLPRAMNDGLAVNIPRIAVTTGEIDAIECVLFKMGLAEGEFAGGQAGGDARVHLYGHDGASIDGGDSNPAEADLHTSLDRMMSYDMLVFDCQGFGFPDHDESDARVREYVNRGGRLFATHLSYTWICDNGVGLAYSEADPFNTGLAASATFPGCATDQGGGLPNPSTGVVSVGRPGANSSKIQDFADWLEAEGAVTETMGQYEFPIVDPRDLATSVGASSEEYVYLDFGGSIQQYAFNTPYGAPDDAICGRVAYSGFHVAPAAGSADYDDADFPAHCEDAAANNGVLSDQEKVLLFSLFDLGACVSEEREPPECEPVDCTGRCGEVPDGCGSVVDCPCVCTQTTCELEGAECGLIPDGCGGQLDCGGCPTGQACELSSSTCEPVCTPMTQVEACDASCGFVSDGCGSVVECPGCADGLNCVAGACVPETCMPQACSVDLECGLVSDGCDSVVACGDCIEPEVCGGAGQANICAIPACVPLTCESASAECGWVGDGCGSAVDCGGCPAGQVCGLIEPNHCDGCQPLDCASAGAQCGEIGDGCGGVVDCGACDSGQVCGAEEPNRCGEGVGCDPLSCADVGAACGQVGDGCGAVVDCGECAGDEICGLAEPFQCDVPPDCEPTTCDAAGASCGSISDQCSGRLDCGVCPSGFFCRDSRCESVGAK